MNLRCVCFETSSAYLKLVGVQERGLLLAGTGSVFFVGMLRDGGGGRYRWWWSLSKCWWWHSSSSYSHRSLHSLFLFGAEILGVQSKVLNLVPDMVPIFLLVRYGIGTGLVPVPFRIKRYSIYIHHKKIHIISFIN